MKRYELEITETVVYSHSVVIEVEDDVAVDTLCNKIEDYADQFDDIYYTDDYANGKVQIKRITRDGSPTCTIEVTDWDEVTE